MIDRFANNFPGITGCFAYFASTRINKINKTPPAGKSPITIGLFHYIFLKNIEK